MQSLAVSVVIPTHNRGSLIGRAIESVISQLEPGDELIVIDDGSTDNTAEVIAVYGSRIHYLKQPNQGAGAARNRGIQRASNPLVTFLDSDDEWMPGHLKLLRGVMIARPDLLYCFTNFKTRFSDGTLRHFSLETQENRELNWDEIMGPARPLSSFIKIAGGLLDCPCHECDNLYLSQCRTNYMSVDTLIFRREQIDERVRFAEDTSTAEEWEFASQLAGTGKGVYLHCESTLVYQHAGQQLTDLDMFELSSSRLKIMRRVWGQDERFLNRHQDYYEQRIREERLLRIGGFLIRGRTKDARAELVGLKNPPFTFALLARLPGGATKAVLDFRRAIKSLFRSGN